MTDHIERLRRFVDSQLRDRASLRVLEAGCGSCGWFAFGERAHLVGIDISE